MKRDQIPKLTSEQVSPARGDWASLLEALGSPNFDDALEGFLSELVGPKGCVAFRHEAIGEVVTCRECRMGNDLSAARACQSSVSGSLQWIHFDGSISVATPGPLQWADVSELNHRLAGAGRALEAILLKHLELANRGGRETEPLSCLHSIERCIADSADLPRREVEVCSRILFGLSSAGIAIDLDLCETTIKTYRKRAYQRLMIGSERELISWYLRAWRRWPAGRGAA